MFSQRCTLLLFLIGAVVLCVAEESLKEQLKYMQMRLNAAANQHALEIASMKKDMDSMREEMRSHMSRNDQHNSQLTLEWAMDTVAELRREMRELEAASNVSNWQQELRNDVAAILAEAEGVSKLAAADGARLAAGEARHAELMLDVRQVRQIASEAHSSCNQLKHDIERVHLDLKASVKSLHKKMYYLTSDSSIITRHRSTSALKRNYRRLRHFHSIHKQINGLRESNENLYVTQNNLKSEMNTLGQKVESLMYTNQSNDESKVKLLIEKQHQHSIAIQNITIDMENLNKLHISMLELLENMETLENKIDKTVPDFQKEISKLDIDVIQLNAKQQYLKDDHETVHQSLKAIAVSVSNLVDKVDRDHSLLQEVNITTAFLHEKIEERFSPLNPIEFVKTNLTTNTDKTAGVNEMINKFQNYKDVQNTENRLPTSCDDVDGRVNNCLIAPDDGASVMTACNDGWTLVQRRINGSVDFNRNYEEYAIGFGTADGEFWIGNEALYRITSNNCTSLRINMLDVNGKYWQADYEYFHIDSTSSGYRLNVSGYSGNATNALEYQNGMQFSTIDRDRDISRSHCAAKYQGGWWFSHCQHVNLNGKYSTGLTWFNSGQNEWIAVAESTIFLRTNTKCNTF